MTPVQAVDLSVVHGVGPSDVQPTFEHDTEHEPPALAGAAFLLRSPGLVMLTNVSILEGYGWLGFISSPSGSGPTGFTSSRPVTVVLAGLLLTAALVLTRPGPGLRRSTGPSAVVAAGVTVAVTTCLVLVGVGTRAGTALGISDLALAVAAITTVVSGGIGRRRWPARAAPPARRGPDGARARSEPVT